MAGSALDRVNGVAGFHRARFSIREVKKENDNCHKHASASRMVKIQSAPRFYMTDGFSKEAANIALLGTGKGVPMAGTAGAEYRGFEQIGLHEQHIVRCLGSDQPTFAHDRTAQARSVGSFCAP
ncbi:MAG: hypothetical protein H6590_02465 [Flavobacteriales bacterium]|nr:hypothetical protein [Flavobacteriales bacterium]